jgi:Spy/CpxP family protein refolding chaperone
MSLHPLTLINFPLIKPESELPVSYPSPLKMTFYMKKIITGMLAIVLFAGAAQAQDSTRHRDHKGNREMASNKLNLTEDQKAKIKSINEARRTEIQALNNTALTADQRKTKMKELHQKYQGQMESVLTPAQKEQMGTSRGKAKGKKAGFGKHGHDGKAKMESLNLTQDQKDRMAKLRESYKGQFEAIRDNKSLSDDQRKEQMKALKEKQHNEMKSILTKEQAEKMHSLKKHTERVK